MAWSWCAVVLGLSLPASADTQPAYIIYRTHGGIEVDGRIDEADWAAAPWTEAFDDIRGSSHPRPRLETRAKMLWDEAFLYVAARLEEPHVWATLTARDSRVYQDNAFEVFIDPDGDTHNYYEIEINALETVWDLLLVRPPRDGGPSLSAWDIQGLQARVHVNGTLNDPSDMDSGWTVEMALPWTVLREAAPGRRPPTDGETWRLNFARSQWTADIVDGTYRKNTERDADWWVWSSQGAVDMHRPERFGYVLFADEPVGAGLREFAVDPNERLKNALRALYFSQREYFRIHGRYAENIAYLESARDSSKYHLQATQSGYEITVEGFDKATVHIRDDGRVWTTTAD